MNTGSGTLLTHSLLGALLVLMAALSWNLIGNLRTHQQLVQDRAELRHVKYGMLNADDKRKDPLIAACADIARRPVTRS